MPADPCACRRALLVAAIACLCAGCAPLVASDVSSPHYRLPTGTTVVVRQTITIPPETAHVTLQDGKLVAPDRLRRYEPFCEIEVEDVLEREQQVQPGRFAVARIVRQQMLGMERQPVLLAAGTADASSATTMFLAALEDTLRLNQIHLRLQSAEQPHVRELRCAGGWAFILDVAYPTLAEMNRALGGLAGIEID